MFKAGFDLIMGIFFAIVCIISLLIIAISLYNLNYSFIGNSFNWLINIHKSYWLFIVPAYGTILFGGLAIIKAIFGESTFN